MPTKQRAVLVTQQQPGNPQGSIEVREIDVPSPAEDEVLLQVLCRPIHPADVIILQFPTPMFSPASLPAVPGTEGVARVVKNGLHSSKFESGQRVVPVTFNLSSGDGSWQQYACVKESVLIAVPDTVTDEAASQFYLNPCTAAGMLDTLQVPKGEWLLQSAAGSALGRQVIQLAKHYGFKTINLVRRREQVTDITEAGGDEALCNDDIAAEVQRITGGRGAYGAIDAVAGDLTAKMVAAIRPKGTLLMYGIMDGTTSNINVMDMLFNTKVVAGYSVEAWVAGLGDRKRAKLEELMGLFGQKVLEPFSGRKFDLAQAAEAVQEAQKPARGGKVLLIG